MSQPNPSPDPQTHAVVGMRAMELIVAGLLLAFGLTVAYASYQLGADWAEDGPKAGYFPFYIGLIIAVSSVVTLAQAWLNRTPKSFLLGIVAAEYVLGWLPRGTHDWNRFIKPLDLKAALERSGLHVTGLQGIAFDVARWDWKLSSDTDVNYMIVAEKLKHS